jgi:hypothetical protein
MSPAQLFCFHMCSLQMQYRIKFSFSIAHTTVSDSIIVFQSSSYFDIHIVVVQILMKALSILTTFSYLRFVSSHISVSIIS